MYSGLRSTNKHRRKKRCPLPPALLDRSAYTTLFVAPKKKKHASGKAGGREGKKVDMAMGNNSVERAGKLQEEKQKKLRGRGYSGGTTRNTSRVSCDGFIFEIFPTHAISDDYPSLPPTGALNIFISEIQASHGLL